MPRTHDQHNAFDKSIKVVLIVAVLLAVPFAILGSVLAKGTDNRAEAIVSGTFQAAENGRARDGGALELQQWLAGRRVLSYVIVDKTVQFFGQSMEVKINVRLETGELTQITAKCNSHKCWGINVRK